MTAALELQGVSSGYGEALVLRELDLTVQPGEIFALLGKNGMGKSTLLKTIMGYLRVRSGRILVAGDETTGSAPHRVARRSVAYTPQEKALFQDLTLAENLQLVMSDAKGVEAGLDRIAGVVSRPARSLAPAGGHTQRRRAKDAADGPRDIAQGEADAYRRNLRGSAADHGYGRRRNVESGAPEPLDGCAAGGTERAVRFLACGSLRST